MLEQCQSFPLLRVARVCLWHNNYTDPLFIASRKALDAGPNALLNLMREETSFVAYSGIPPLNDSIPKSRSPGATSPPTH